MFGQDSASKFIANQWITHYMNRNPKTQEWKELRNYIFATDTRTTSNGTLPWKNSTTLPKLCQIRDNLHSNYLSALFPNDDWLRWEAYTQDDATKAKRVAIESYMSNKTRESHFRTEMTKLLLDYIDYGNAFATTDFENSYREDENGNKVIQYVGPKARRISPLDIVFNPLAASFADSWKIVRSVVNLGELVWKSENEPENAQLADSLEKRKKLVNYTATYGIEQWDKAEGFQIDGFGSYTDYLGQSYVEVLTFYGDLYDNNTGELKAGRKITIIDRMWTIEDIAIPTWFGTAPIYHVGWRVRPDNLWAMGPLDNLVGMQYRIDHLENLKADAMDLAVLPPLVIAGEVEEFTYAPGEEIHIDAEGSVTELAKNVQWVLQAESQVQALEQRMEQYAGAPREAMGIRTPGEKTAFEVQTLENAAGRIFQEKINTFEIEMLEPLLNSMLETARRNLDGEDVVRVMDNDLGVQQFLKLTRDDITANGILRPIGARHFAAQAQLLQNLQGVFNGPMQSYLAPHTSGIALSRLVEDILGLTRFSLFSPNKAVFEQQETQRLINGAQENLGTEQNMAATGQAPAGAPASAPPTSNAVGRMQALQTRQQAKAML
jgi:hypothetical protein